MEWGTPELVEYVRSITSELEALTRDRRDCAALSYLLALAREEATNIWHAQVVAPTLGTDAPTESGSDQTASGKSPRAPSGRPHVRR